MERSAAVYVDGTHEVSRAGWPSPAAGRGMPVGEHPSEGRCAQRLAALQVFGVLGNPVAHSRSPALHNAALAAAGLDAVYLPFLVDDLRSFLRSFSAPDFKGFSVTIPHKVPASHRALSRAGYPAASCLLEHCALAAWLAKLLAGPKNMHAVASAWPRPVMSQMCRSEVRAVSSGRSAVYS